METKNIIGLLEKSFTRNAWHGPAVLEAIKDIKPKMASTRLSKKTHSIGELVLHMTAWRIFVIKKLKGEKFEMTESLNFPKPGGWDSAVLKLKKSQRELIEAIHSFPENSLLEKVPGREYDFYTMLHGVIQHDLYHTGQIMLIRKSMG